MPRESVDNGRERAMEVVEVLHTVLGDTLVGAYQHGSAVLGGLSWRSDIDVLAVTSGPTTAAQRQSLVEQIMPVSGAYGSAARSIELVVVSQQSLRPWRYPPTCELLYGEWLRGDFERGETAQPAPARDLAVLVTQALMGTSALYGPPPADVFDPVPRDDLIDACLSGVPGLLEDLASDTTNVLLTLARIWFTTATGAVVRKDEAAGWALTRLEPDLRQPLGRARAVYLGDATDGWHTEEAAARRTATALVAAIGGQTAGR